MNEVSRSYETPNGPKPMFPPWQCCTLCSGCLPDGEQCLACGRIQGAKPESAEQPLGWSCTWQPPTPTERERRLEEELSQWQKFASYCRCCAQSGESDPMQFVDFVAEIARAALTPKGKA